MGSLRAMREGEGGSVCRQGGSGKAYVFARILMRAKT